MHIERNEMKADKLDKMFMKQREFMDMLREHDRLPEFPVDLHTKNAQRLIKEQIFNLVEEICEASFTLKNRVHKISDDRSVDLPHYKEELVDALSYFLEICILSGIDSKELYEEYARKNKTVKERLQNGY